MTLIVCPNLAIDRVLTAAAVNPNELTRCHALLQQAGGKGANVARALRGWRDAGGGDGVLGDVGGDVLGDGDGDDRHGDSRRTSTGHSLLLGFAAGHAGRLFAECAAEEGLATELITHAGETRLSTAILTDDGSVIRLFECGPQITAGDEKALFAAVAAHQARTDEWAVVDGAAPPGADDLFYGALCQALRAAGYHVLVDAAGTQLTTCLDVAPDFVKVNLAETHSAVGTPRAPCGSEERPSAAELGEEGLELARRLVAAGARDAVVTLGAAGAAGLIGGREWRVQTPPITAINAVGSGDCFAAGLIAAFEGGESIEAALAAAAGLAAANAASALTAHFDLGLARELAGRARVGPHIA